MSSRYLAPLGKIPQGLWRIFIKYVEGLSIQIMFELSCSLEVFPHSSTIQIQSDDSDLIQIIFNNGVL